MFSAALGPVEPTRAVTNREVERLFRSGALKVVQLDGCDDRWSVSYEPADAPRRCMVVTVAAASNPQLFRRAFYDVVRKLFEEDGP